MKEQLIELITKEGSVYEVNAIEQLADYLLENGVVVVVRCKDCDVPHNKWTGCPNLNGLIPYGDFYCAKGKPKEKPKEVKQAQWEIDCDGYYLYCSNCRHEPEGRKMTRFCENCGAEMVGVK